MKKLSEFKNEAAICVIADLIEPVFNILANAKNQKLKDEVSPLKMFSGFFKNSPHDMMTIFAILSEKDPDTYECDGVDAAANLAKLASDEKLFQLFISQAQTGDAKSSAPASETTEASKQ